MSRDDVPAMYNQADRTSGSPIAVATTRACGGTRSLRRERKNAARLYRTYPAAIASTSRMWVSAWVGPQYDRVPSMTTSTTSPKRSRRLACARTLSTSSFSAKCTTGPPLWGRIPGDPAPMAAGYPELAPATRPTPEFGAPDGTAGDPGAPQGADSRTLRHRSCRHLR